jgi:hypothetical protein
VSSETEDQFIDRIKQEYKDRLDAAKTKEELCGIQAQMMDRVYKFEMDRMSQTTLDLKGEVVDQNGKRLDGVRLTVRKQPYSRPQPGWSDTPELPPEILTVNGDFDVSYRGLSRLDLAFTKDGYYSEAMEFLGGHSKHNLAEFARLTLSGVLTPGAEKGRIRLTLEKLGKTTRLQQWRGLTVDGAWRAEVLDFTKKPSETEQDWRFVKIVGPQDVPANCVAAVMDRDQMTGAVLRQKRPGSLVCDYPVGVTLYLNAAKGGFIPYDPKHPPLALREMKLAPEAGYKAELSLSGKSLVSLATNEASGDPAKCVYFFFKTADGKYGKGVIISAGGPARDVKSYVSIIFYLQPDGSRNLEDPTLHVP